MTDAADWFDLTKEELVARWAISYGSGAVELVLKQLNKRELVSEWRKATADGEAVLQLGMLVEHFGFPVWLVPSKVGDLNNLTEQLIARPSKTKLLCVYLEMCEAIPDDIHGCPAKGIIFNWPHHNTYMTFHDLQNQPLGGHGWFFHRKADGRRLTLQSLKSLVLGLGDPNDWAN